MNKNYLPAAVKNALIEVCGSGFWYKQSLFDMFERAGIPANLYRPYEGQAKFIIARRVLQHLEANGEDGYLIQRRLVTELCHLRDLPDPKSLPDPARGRTALADLKTASAQYQLHYESQQQEAATRQETIAKNIADAQGRESKLSQLRERFSRMVAADNPQARGYDLEELLRELFQWSGINYRKSYRLDNEQIDGSFRFDSFNYLVEARWRNNKAAYCELAVFKEKVDRKLQSTRGVVVSINGFDDGAVRRLCKNRSTNLILMTGADLVLILEGQIELSDALRAKIDKAAEEGTALFPLTQYRR